MSNRVEELESKVAELQAAVDGLTEELVETRERLHQLETEHGVEVKRAPERRERPSVEEDNSEAAEPSDEEASESSSESDSEPESEEESAEEESDIIVA